MAMSILAPLAQKGGNPTICIDRMGMGPDVVGGTEGGALCGRLCA